METTKACAEWLGPELSADEESELLYGSPLLDTNQEATFSRVLQRLFDTNPLADETWLIQEAARQARASVETAASAAEQIAEMRSGPAYCYLAFHGMDGIAQFAKVGMSRHPERRLYGMATGNPLDCLWVYVCKLPTARAAYHVEQSLLRHMEAQRRRGEWITLGRIEQDAAAALARSMGELAQSLEPEAGEFAPLGSCDGR